MPRFSCAMNIHKVDASNDHRKPIHQALSQTIYVRYMLMLVLRLDETGGRLTFDWQLIGKYYPMI
ncbi:hypothetical protein COCNU_10G008960 [Cocos nucifera]|uniref:Uncharacterized protein n=1 Tax=Cocos nucifera TaxID=13894 RepID=A0A8K0IN80_COCNU|nr:hypothetical protein COCNU_10G008960 [Cocos nucifera]